MQPIRDKGFDQLFKNAFEDAEMAPTRDLWSSIESEIEPKKKRTIPVLWLSAAAVLIIATVSVQVYQQQEVNPKQFANNVDTKTAKPVVETLQVQDSTKTITTLVMKQKEVSEPTFKAVDAVAKTVAKEEVKRLVKPEAATVPDVQEQVTVIAQVKEPKQDINAKIEEVILHPTEAPVLAANLAPAKADEVIGDHNQVESKGIRNVGDVVNLIVNTVDKRKDKFIQFRTDDDDSSIASLNIGPFRFGKKK